MDGLPSKPLRTSSHCFPKSGPSKGPEPLATIWWTLVIKSRRSPHIRLQYWPGIQPLADPWKDRIAVQGSAPECLTLMIMWTSVPRLSRYLQVCLLVTVFFAILGTDSDSFSGLSEKCHGSIHMSHTSVCVYP
jgi:hypothetical protein